MTAPASAPERLLSTAGELFARHGIRGVGIDRILAESGVAKATLYQSFGSKESLIVSYLERRDATDRASYAAHLALCGTDAERLTAFFDLAERSAHTAGFLGCVYANAMNEFPDPELPIGATVRRHREWVREQWIATLAPRPDAGALADQLQLIYDGALLGAKLSHSAEPIRRGRALALRIAGLEPLRDPAAA